MTIWWHARPSWLRWSLWASLMLAVVTVSNFARALDALNPWLPATRAYVGDALSPVLVATLSNTIEIITAREASIKVRIQMANARLQAVPDDMFARESLNAATRDIEAAELQMREAYCSLRQAQGLGCGR